MSAQFPIAPAAEAVRFAGYAAIFGVPDASGDILHPGAFAASLAQRPPGRGKERLTISRPGRATDGS